MTFEEKYALYEYLGRPDVQKKIAEIFMEELLRGMADIKDIKIGEKYEANS